MLINIHSPLVSPSHGLPVTHNGGEVIGANSLPIRCPNNCDLRAVCITLEQKLLPPHHACYKELKYNAKVRREYYKRIGKYIGVGKALFQTHNTAHRFITDHLESLYGKIFMLTTQIAAMHHKSAAF